MKLSVVVVQSESKVSKAGKAFFPALLKVDDQVGKVFLDKQYPEGKYEAEVELKPNFGTMFFEPRFKLSKSEKTA